MMMALTGINDLGYINTFNAYICQMAVGFLFFFSSSTVLAVQLDYLSDSYRIHRNTVQRTNA